MDDDRIDDDVGVDAGNAGERWYGMSRLEGPDVVEDPGVLAPNDKLGAACIG